MKENQNSKNTKTLLLSVIAVVALIAIVGGATFAFFATTRDIDASTPVNTQTASKSYTFIASANEKIEFNLSASEMSEASASTNVLKSDTANVNVEVASATNEETTTCTYDIQWIWDSTEKYTESDVELPYNRDGKTYPYELSITVDGKNETDLSDLTWIDGKAIVANDLEIESTSKTPIKLAHKIEVKSYNIPVDQQKLFNKNFKAHLEVVNNSCALTKNQVIATAYNNSHEYDGNGQSITVNVTKPTSGVTIYYSTITPLNASNYTSGSISNPVIYKGGTTTVYWCAVANNYNSICSSNEINIVKNLVTYIKNDVYTEDGVHGLYYHDGVGTYTNANLEAGDNSYRYSGTDPNNYLCFKEGCTDDEKYRIIGAIDNKVKIIKMTNAKSGPWNSIMNNKWEGSTMETYLNGDYIRNLKDVTKLDTDNLIETTTWHVGGMAMEKLGSPNTVKDTYTVELTSTPIIERQVGLMYTSDYGYAADPTYWSKSLNNYNSSIGHDWMITIGGWTISRATINNGTAFYVRGDGWIHNSNTPTNMCINPSFNLSSSVKIKSGTGTSDDPYIVGL